MQIENALRNKAITCSLCCREYAKVMDTQGDCCAVFIDEMVVYGVYGSVFDDETLVFSQRPESYKIGKVMCDYCVCKAIEKGILIDKSRNWELYRQVGNGVKHKLIKSFRIFNNQTCAFFKCKGLLYYYQGHFRHIVCLEEPDHQCPDEVVAYFKNRDIVI